MPEGKDPKRARIDRALVAVDEVEKSLQPAGEVLFQEGLHFSGVGGDPPRLRLVE